MNLKRYRSNVKYYRHIAFNLTKSLICVELQRDVKWMGKDGVLSATGAVLSLVCQLIMTVQPETHIVL